MNVHGKGMNPLLPPLFRNIANQIELFNLGDRQLIIEKENWFQTVEKAMSKLFFPRNSHDNVYFTSEWSYGDLHLSKSSTNCILIFNSIFIIICIIIMPVIINSSIKVIIFLIIFIIIILIIDIFIIHIILIILFSYYNFLSFFCDIFFINYYLSSASEFSSCLLNNIYLFA